MKRKKIIALRLTSDLLQNEIVKTVKQTEFVFRF